MAPDPVKMKSNTGIYSRVVSPSTADPKGDDTHKHPPLAFLLPKGKYRCLYSLLFPEKPL